MTHSLQLVPPALNVDVWLWVVSLHTRILLIIIQNYVISYSNSRWILNAPTIDSNYELARHLSMVTKWRPLKTEGRIDVLAIGHPWAWWPLAQLLPAPVWPKTK